MIKFLLTWVKIFHLLFWVCVRIRNKTFRKHCSVKYFWFLCFLQEKLQCEEYWRAELWPQSLSMRTRVLLSSLKKLLTRLWILSIPTGRLQKITFNFNDQFRKYIKRQKNLQKALSWWEDEEQNQEIGYLDFSKRKILFNFGSFRRGSEASINIRWMNLEILDRNCSKLIVTRSLSDHESTKGLPGHFLRKWKRAGAVLNAANLLRSSLQKKRYFTDS